MTTHRIMRWLNRACLLAACMVISSFLRLLFEERETFLDTKNTEVNHYCQNDGCSHGPDKIDVIQRDNHQNEINDLGTGALFTEQVVLMSIRGDQVQDSQREEGK